MVGWRAFLLAVTLLITGCGSTGDQSSPDTPTSNEATQGETSNAGELPPLREPSEFADAGSPVELPELIGLTEAEVREWGQAAGFTVVKQSEAFEGAFSSTRLVIELADDAVTVASVG